MTEVETAWIAGVLEGEGCFSLSFHPLKNGSTYPRFEVKCNMTDKDVVLRLQKITGAGNFRGPVLKCDQEGREGKPQWIWTLGRSSGLQEFLEAILPHMGKRRSSKIKEMLKAMKTHPPRQAWKHGTRYGYEVKKCKCTECREANNLRHRLLRSQRV